MSEAELLAEIDRLREKNRELNRRCQEGESEAAAMLREHGYAKAVREAAAGKAAWDHWKNEFDRVIACHAEMKEIYEMVAPVLGLPYGKYHSVMDSCFVASSRVTGRERGTYANVFPNYPKGGCESFLVVDKVREAIALLQAPPPNPTTKEE